VARLADQKTSVETKEMVRDWLSFVADDGVTEYAGQVEAIVWVMPGMDFIVGLPDIASNYVDLLVSVLKNENDVNEVTDMREGEVRICEVEVWPEELDTPDPVAFGPVLAFMETNYEESRKEYFDSLEKHVGEQLIRCESFMELLKSDLAVDRFVPKEWTGIKGFPPLDLQVKNNFPPMHKADLALLTRDCMTMQRLNMNV